MGRRQPYRLTKADACQQDRQFDPEILDVLDDPSRYVRPHGSRLFGRALAPVCQTSRGVRTGSRPSPNKPRGGPPGSQ
jgi:hypothetical protein